MSNNEKQIYLRVLADLPFMLEILRSADYQADTFTVEMLRERIVREREAVRLEEDRLQREAAERIIRHEQEKIERDLT